MYQYAFDLRLYILLTSIDPMKLNIFEDDLIRFATEEFTNNPEQIFNNYIHLTNYIVNNRGVHRSGLFSKRPFFSYSGWGIQI